MTTVMKEEVGKGLWKEKREIESRNEKVFMNLFKKMSKFL